MASGLRLASILVFISLCTCGEGAEDELKCRIEFLEPSMGQVVQNEDAVLEYQLVDCVGFSEEESVVVELDGREVARFAAPAMSVSLRSILAGHHSLFLQIQPCSACAFSVNGSVFFTTRIASSAMMDRQVLAMVEERTLRQYFLLSSQRPSHAVQLTAEPRNGSPHHVRTSESMGLESMLALGRLVFAMGDLSEAIVLLHSATSRILNGSQSREGEELLETCIHYHQALVMIMYAEKQGRPVTVEEACRHHLSITWPLPRGSAKHLEEERVGFEDMAYGVVSGQKLYHTRARAVAETWMGMGIDGHIYGEVEEQMKISRCRDKTSCEESLFTILRVPIPEGSNKEWLEALTLADNFFSSVPKVRGLFVLALVDLLVKYPHKKWFYLAGCDTFILPRNVGKAVQGLDENELVFVGGHAGMHFGTLFLSGGSGLIFSRALAHKIAQDASFLLRSWMEKDGPRFRCTPCADVAFVHFSRILQGKMVERPCFYAFWPQYYISEEDGEVVWPWDEAEEATSDERVRAFLSSCSRISVKRGGLGVAARETRQGEIASQQQPLRSLAIQIPPPPLPSRGSGSLRGGQIKLFQDSRTSAEDHQSPSHSATFTHTSAILPMTRFWSAASHACEVELEFVRAVLHPLAEITCSCMTPGLTVLGVSGYLPRVVRGIPCRIPATMRIKTSSQIVAGQHPTISRSPQPDFVPVEPAQQEPGVKSPSM
ncbi:hypothetical protein GUITHDRAFT_106224 [Guillardia theta CCMP2712]|uniref:Uncharacterized protein n=2 Tax=Guillardia theta TaxID=55529 RepID=L1JHZ6_GUITC|nr:hypothetical protein GUITHDRAFT_106224 [Guillardia theta CCMP2712]EKX48148.1 hypothetical protein GUITHDRAFT_106224 [Guillardia theta CCMP2712]|eukprot:XP_005835128.1 hypothetical protein GUITHDRAFT_106224 [Guillardia theta CCMP2712]